MMSNFLCPIDNKDDLIQKVSVVVDLGHSSGSFSGPTGTALHLDGEWGSVFGFTSLRGETVSRLADKLSPPPEPRRKGGIGCWWAWVINWFVWGTISILISACLLIAMISNSINSFLPISDAYGNNYTLWFTVGFIGFLILGSLALFGAVALMRLDRKKKAEAEILFNNQLRIYNAAMAKWDRSYICFRHGIIFDAISRQICDIDHFMEFLLN
jgi:hypothetical protein